MTALLAALAVAGCKSGPGSRLAAAEVPVSAIVMYPFGFRWPEPAYRSFELSHRLLALAIDQAGDSVLLLGPPELKVYRPEDNGWASNNAAALLPALRLQPEQAILLRPWAERRIASSRQELFDARGRPVGSGAAQETTYIGHVEVIHPSTQAVLLELAEEARVDPFAPRAEDEADPTPELTRLMLALTGRALEALRGRLQPPGKPRDFGLTCAFNPQAILTYSEEGRPSLEAILAQADPLEAEILRVARVRFANPGISDAQASLLSRLPGGLYVRRLPPASPLQAGDLITAIAGEPALPQTLQRARFSEGPVPLRVRRADGTSAELAL
jgi:hypothetical protein